MKNIWLLSEEKAKVSVIYTIIEKFGKDNKIKLSFSNDLKILPVMSDRLFKFEYEVVGISSDKFNKVYIKLASGNSSFVDYLLFYQKDIPDINSKPLYAIEETKTDDSESRNTGVYQRCSKFVFVDFYYPGIKKIMLYSLQIPQKKNPTATNIFGTRMLLTLGVEVLGKSVDKKIMKPFKNLNELVDFKNSMRDPYGDNVPIKIKVLANKIQISGKLYKSDRLSHDPNIGALTIMSLCIRKWEKIKPIEITKHGLMQRHVGKRNKFVLIANKLKIGLKGLRIPKADIHEGYWYYDTTQEKNGSIFVHVLIDSFTNARIIYDNHGGCERGYFINKDKKPITIEKYQEGKREQYKKGDKTKIIYIPDLIVYDSFNKEISNIEGKTYQNRKKGIKELNNYKYIENKIIKPEYNPKKIIRTVVLYGSKQEKIRESKVGLLLNEDGKIIIGKNCPSVIKKAVKELYST